MSTLIGIKYTGTKNRPQPDPIAGTNLVWLDTEQVHYVSESTAYKLLKNHPDIFAETDRKEGDVDPVDQPPEVPSAKKEDEQEPAPLVPLDTMERAALIVFAQSHFGQKLAPNMTEANMRLRIRNWMNNSMATA